MTGWRGARPRAVFCRRAICCRRRMRWRSSRARPAKPQSDSCASPCRSCRTSPISTISIRSMPSPRSILFACGRARRCPAMPISSCCPARRRRSPILRRCAPPASTSTSPRIGAAAAWCLGLCGGYQMLGRTIADPDGIEGPPGKVEGLGLHRCRNDAVGRKAARSRCAGTTSDGAPFAGYEMHMGVTEGPDRARPFARLADGSPEGAVSADGRVIGTYVHGLFADDRQRAAWLARFARGPDEHRLRRSGRAHARCARGASRRASRSRSAAQIGAMRMRRQDGKRARSGSRRRSGKAPARGGCRRHWRRGARRPSVASSTRTPP